MSDVSCGARFVCLQRVSQAEVRKFRSVLLLLAILLNNNNNKKKKRQLFFFIAVVEDTDDRFLSKVIDVPQRDVPPRPPPNMEKVQQNNENQRIIFGYKHT